MSLSVQLSVVKPFEFNGKKAQSVHVNGEECLGSRDVYKAIEYQEENGKKNYSKFSSYKVQAAFWRRKSLAKSVGRYFPAAQRYSLVKRAWASLLSFKIQER